MPLVCIFVVEIVDLMVKLIKGYAFFFKINLFHCRLSKFFIVYFKISKSIISEGVYVG